MRQLLRRTIFLSVGLAALLLIPASALTQERGRIVGTVTDAETGQVIPELTLTLQPLGRSAITNEDGRFQIRDLHPGEYYLQLDHVAYGTQSVAIDVPRGRTVAIDIPLAPKAIEMEPLEVRVDVNVRDPYLERRGYYERKDWAQKVGHGDFLDGEELESRGSSGVDHILSTLPDLRAVGGGGQRGLVVFNRHRKSFYGGPCLPAIYLDGRKIVGSVATGSARGPGPRGSKTASPTTRALNRYLTRLGGRGINSIITGSDLAAIEVYEGPASTAGEFIGSDSRCGVIALWTKRGPRGQ